MTAFALLFPFPNLNSSSRISWHFYQLSVCHRLITYALLTRPPLSYTYSIRRLPIHTFVRLACVRHAASVHPEPGSNSQLKFILQLLHWLLCCYSLLTLFQVCLVYYPIFIVHFYLITIFDSCKSCLVQLIHYTFFIFFCQAFFLNFFIFLLSFLCFKKVLLLSVFILSRWQLGYDIIFLSCVSIDFFNFFQILFYFFISFS